MDPRGEREAFLSEAEDLWSGHDHRGWNRASIRFWSRSPSGPAVRPEDLVLPSGLGNLRMLQSCAGMALMITVLHVWFPLLLLTFFVSIGAKVFAGILVGAFVSLTAGLYLWGTVETQRDRELAARL